MEGFSAVHHGESGLRRTHIGQNAGQQISNLQSYSSVAPYLSPLRYPGGKRRLAPMVVRLLEENQLRGIDYVEPYAGGAAIALALLFGEHAATVHINDLSRPVYAFWHTVLNHTADLTQRVANVRLSMREWRRQRAIYDGQEKADLADLGFATLFLNRTNRSGIIGGGVIGGKAQRGEWRIDARFNRSDLVERIRRIGRYRSRIRLYQHDALEFTKTIIPTLGSNTFTFFDPPYIENGEDLYLNNYDVDGHQELAFGVGSSQPALGSHLRHRGRSRWPIPHPAANGVWTQL